MYSKLSANYSNKEKGHGNLIGFGILKKSTNNGDSNSINSSQTRENNEETQQGKELDAILKRLDSLETDKARLKVDVDKLKADNTSLKADNTSLKADVDKLKVDNTSLKADNTSLKADVDKLKNRLVGIESLIARNNINIDLLVNRDSLKTILLLFSINKGILTTKHLYKDLLGEYSCKENFSSLVVKSLRYLDSKLIHSGFYRKGMISLRSDNPEEIKKDLIFVESIHFIVCTIDNIIHPPSKNTPKTFSKIIGRRALDTLSQGLKLFFTNPKTIPELNQIMPKESKSEAENELEFDNYDEAKNTTYLINKKYCKILEGKNNYYSSFFIQYLFDPQKDNISQVNLAINYDELDKKINEVLNVFKDKNKKYDPYKLIENLKWN